MTKIELTTGCWLLVEVDKDHTYFDLYGDEKSLTVNYTVMTSPGKFKAKNIQLPPGDWDIIGKGNRLTEEEWKGIVPYVRGGFFGHIPGYKRFENETWMDVEPHPTATASGQSLLASKGMKPETTLILKQLI